MDVITLSTYGWYDEGTDAQHELCFDVPTDWLTQYTREHFNMELHEFILKYTWGDTMDVYAAALKEKVIKEEWEV